MRAQTKRRGRPAHGGALSAAERMRRYRARKRASGLRLITQWQEMTAGPLVFSDHRFADARSLALHCAIVRKIDRDRALLEIARRNIENARRRGLSSNSRPVAAWLRLLKLPWPQLAAQMTALTERAAALRQSSPFAGVLTAAERKRIYDAFRA